MGKSVIGVGEWFDQVSAAMSDQKPFKKTDNEV